MPGDHSPELDQVRRLLFPSLPADQGWALIDEAIQGSQDEERMAKVEELAEGALTADLLEALRRLRSSGTRER